MEHAPRRRQARGELRMSQILEAAAAVFARTGVEGATTNAIAAQAGISPGSLYQFFRGKSEIAAALGRQYADQLTAAHLAAFDAFDSVRSPLADVLDHTLDPIVAVKNSNAAFAPMFARPDLPAAIVAPVAEAEQAFSLRLVQLLGDRNPDVDADQIRSAATTIIGLVRGALGQREADIGELKLAILGYLAIKGIR